MKTATEIIKTLMENKTKLIPNIEKESIAAYCFLNQRYKEISEKKKKVSKDYLFKFIFRSYYRLDSAGLSDAFKDKYFQLLEAKVSDLKTILAVLYNINTLRGYNTVQFSFASKLLHTIDNSNPIFDSNISLIIGDKPDGTRKDEKISSCTEFYKKLKTLYKELMKRSEIQSYISEFKETYKKYAFIDISDTKILDFMLWSLGKLTKID